METRHEPVWCSCRCGVSFFQHSRADREERSQPLEGWQYTRHAAAVLVPNVIRLHSRSEEGLLRIRRPQELVTVHRGHGGNRRW